MIRVSFIGADSIVFARNLVGDLLAFEQLRDSEVVLMDIDRDRLDRTATAARNMSRRTTWRPPSRRRPAGARR